MEWMVMNMDRFFNPSMKLRAQSGGTFVIPDNCEVKLQEILQRLNQDRSRWHFRRSLFMNRIISENLLPILIEGKSHNQVGILSIKVLQELLTPIECLMPTQMNKPCFESQRVVHELQKAVCNAKKLFLDPRATKAIVEIITGILQNSNEIKIEDCETINHCLLLVRNLLHVQSTPEFSFHSDGNQRCDIIIEDQLMWNLFAQRFDYILIQLLTCPQQHLWNITMVQLVSLMYREQQQGAMRNLINEWLVSSVCDSGEDEENNPLSTYSSDILSTTDSDSDSCGRLRRVRLAFREQKLKKESPTPQVQHKVGEFFSVLPKEENPEFVGGSAKDSPMNVSVLENKYNYLSTTSDSSSMDEDVCSDCKPSFTVSKRESVNEEDSQAKRIKMDKSSREYMSWMPNTELPMIKTNNLCNNAIWNLSNTEGKSNNVTTCVDKEICIKESKLRNDLPIKPPDEKESESGDSSERRPPPILPKLLKGKHLSIQKRSRHSMSHKFCLEHQETTESSNSTGSECDEKVRLGRIHQKPHKMLVKPRPPKSSSKQSSDVLLKRTKLLLRKESLNMRPKALLHHAPTQNDITNLLKEFTVDFVLNGYASLVQGLRLQVLQPNQVDLDKSHLLWLLTYFLRIAVQFDLELGQISPILSMEVVSYLVYEGVVIQEDLEITIQRNQNHEPQIRRLHLVVTALREFFVSMGDVSEMHEALGTLPLFTESLCQMTQLRYIFIYLIRMYRPDIMSINYLQDLITINHRFLLTSESMPEQKPSFNIIEHIKHFSNAEMMQHYGLLLSSFQENGEFVNDCIFTMMHHIAGTLKGVNVLLQPSILKTFLRIWKEEMEIRQDWTDLVDYVLRKCARINLKYHSRQRKKGVQNNEELNDDIASIGPSSTKQELVDKLYEIFADDSWQENVKDLIMDQLLSCGYIDACDRDKIYRSSVKEEPWITTKLDGNDVPEGNLLDSIENSERLKSAEINEVAAYTKLSPEHVDDEDWHEICASKKLINKIEEAKGAQCLNWVQDQVLEACYAKIEVFSPKSLVVEPIAIHSTVSQQPIPIVPMTKDQEDILFSTDCTDLLTMLEFHMPRETLLLYPRIPAFWGPDELYEIAQKFGQINKDTLKFSVEALTNVLQLSRNNTIEHDDSYWQKSSSLGSSQTEDDFSMESVSVCSMENNGSTSPSPVSSENEQEEEDIELTKFQADKLTSDGSSQGDSQKMESDSAFAGSANSMDSFDEKIIPTH